MVRATRAKQSGSARTYTSPRRQRQAAETKAAVLDAARTLFSERGWAGTSMRDVAGHAGVAVETLYALFGSKPDLFQAALEVAVVGDLDPVPVAGRPEFLAQAEGSLEERIRAGTHFLARTHRDSAGLHRALREGAASDPGLARLLTDNEERRKADVAVGIEMIAGRRPTPTERDGSWALGSFEVYDLLVERCGWSLRRYEEWQGTLMSLWIQGPTGTAEAPGGRRQKPAGSNREGGRA